MYSLFLLRAITTDTVFSRTHSKTSPLHKYIKCIQLLLTVILLSVILKYVNKSHNIKIS